MEHRTDELLKLASELQQCLHTADKLKASFAAIKIMEAHESILDLADDGLNESSAIVGTSKPTLCELDTESQL